MPYSIKDMMMCYDILDTAVQKQHTENDSHEIPSRTSKQPQIHGK